MVAVCKLGGTFNQTGVKGGKSKGSNMPPQSLSFSFSPRPRFSRLAAHHSPLVPVRSRDVPSIALKTLGKERDCSQSMNADSRAQNLSSCRVKMISFVAQKSDGGNSAISRVI